MKKGSASISKKGSASIFGRVVAIGRFIAILVALVAFWADLASTYAVAASPAPVAHTDAMRGTTPLAEEGRPPPLGNAENKDVRRNRAFPMQPPTIPHKIDGYQVDKNVNKCMTCHSRMRIEETRAIPIPATHYMDRDGTLLGDVSTRRYFCTQCHVTQDEVKLLIDNRYQDFDAVRAAAKAAGAPAAGAKKR
jgi:cytochrome c-type protein NapB